MPLTPYHFGPSGLIGLLFKRWIDLPVFVLANVVVDIEVLVILLFGLGCPVHRYCHTLLIGGAVGALWGFGAYPLRGLWRGIMSAFRLPYQPTIGKMVISGVLGVWTHVLIDGMQHADMKILWPNTTFSLVAFGERYLGGHRVEHLSVLLLLCALAVYGFQMSRSNHAAPKDGTLQLTRNPQRPIVPKG